jgi:hypothetical protein
MNRLDPIIQFITYRINRPPQVRLETVRGGGSRGATSNTMSEYDYFYNSFNENNLREFNLNNSQQADGQNVHFITENYQNCMREQRDSNGRPCRH